MVTPGERFPARTLLRGYSGDRQSVLTADTTTGGTAAIVRGRQTISALTSQGAEYLIANLHGDLLAAMDVGAETLGKYSYGGIVVVALLVGTGGTALLAIAATSGAVADVATFVQEDWHSPFLPAPASGRILRPAGSSPSLSVRSGVRVMPRWPFSPDPPSDARPGDPGPVSRRALGG